MVETKRLGDIATYINGYAFKPDDWCKEGLPIVRIQDLTGTSYQQNYYKGDYPAKIEINDGDVLISWSASLGVHIWDRGKALLNQHIFKVVFDKVEVDKQYFVYAVQYNLENMLSKMHGATMKHIVKKDFDNIEVPFPTLAEQKRVASILTYAKDAIEDRKQQLTKLDNLVKSRFVEIFGDLANPDCSWNKCQLVDACKEEDDIKCGPFGTQLSKDEYKKSGIAVWEIPQINTAFMTEPTHYLTEEKAKQLRAYTIIPGDIAMSRKGNVGKCALFPETYSDGIIHSDVLRIRVNKRIVNPVFMMYQLHFSGAVTRQIELVSSGAIMAGVNVTKLKRIYVHIPPIKLQDEFADFVAQVDKSKVAIQAALDKTQLLFDSLMQEYFG